MKKFFTLAALLLLMVVSANATKRYASFETPAGNGSWDSETCLYSWTGSFSNLVTIFETPNGSLADYESLHLTTSGYTDSYRVCFMQGSNALATIAFYSAGQKDLVFAERSETKDLDLSKIDHIAFGGNSGSGSVTLKKVYLEKPTEIVFDESGKAYIYPSDFTLNGWQGMTFDEETGILTKTKTGYEGITFDFGTAGLDFSNITNIEVNAETTGDYVNLFGYGTVTDLNGHNQYISGSTGSYAKGSSIDSNIQKYYLGANETTGSMKLNYVCLTSKTLGCVGAGETPIDNLQYYNMDGTKASTVFNTKTSTSTYYGSGSSDPCNYVDVTDYEELRIYRDTETAFRAFFINKDATGTNNINSSSDGVTWNAAGSYYSVDLSKVEKYNDKIYLNTVKSAYSWVPDAINSIILYKTPAVGDAQYHISGAGVMTANVSAALADASATLIDATGVTGSNVSLVSANPNCIFQANSGVLANENNVMVDGTIANLVITDGSEFAAPAGATATAATYTRAANGSFGTVCLPYEVKSDDNVQYYTLLSSDESSITIEKVDKVGAGTPAIFKNLNDAENITVAGSGTLSAAVEGSTTGTLTLKGTYTKQTFTDGLDSKYYISGGNVMQATASLTVNPFRAYMEAEESVDAKLAILVVEDTPTAVNALFNADKSNVKVAAIYSVNGAQQSELKQGINVVKFSDGTSKKVILK